MHVLVACRACCQGPEGVGGRSPQTGLGLEVPGAPWRLRWLEWRGAAGGPPLGTGGDGRIPGGTWEQLPVLVWNEKPSEMPARADGMAQTQRVGTWETSSPCQFPQK